MELGRIFKGVTGTSVTDFDTPAELWSEIGKVREIKRFNQARYGNDVVRCRGGVFALNEYVYDVDAMIENL